MLISNEYQKEQERLHKNPNYGVASVEFAPVVTSIINSLGIAEMLDYGAGKGRLGQSIEPANKLLIDHYDPAIDGWKEAPEPRQFVACIDVLEHIEKPCLNAVLDDLQRCVKEYGLFSVHTGPALKILSDGRNAHLIQEDYKWWLPRLWSRFDIHSMNHTPSGFYVLVRAKNELIEL